MEDNLKSPETANLLLAAAGVGVVGSVGAAVGIGGTTGLLVAFLILLLLVLLAGGYLLWQKMKRRRASSNFQSGLNQEAAQAPLQVKDPVAKPRWTKCARVS